MKEQLKQEKLRLMVFKSALELGNKIDEHLLDLYNYDKNKYTFIVPINELFFEDGHLKVEINSTVRGKNVFLLTDIGNYSIEYNMHGFINHASPNDLLEQLLDGIGASNCHADKLNVIMPLLYAGRQHRRNVYLNSFNSKYIKRYAGGFIKQRDYNRFEGGKYPVISHDYFGTENIKGKTAIVVDDMISSGGSMFDVIDELNKRKVGHIYIMVTFALFTRGIDKFKEYYEKGFFDGIYTTNLSYIPECYKQEKWLHVCDCSSEIAEIIYNMHNDLSITDILSDKSKPIKLLERKFNNE